MTERRDTERLISTFLAEGPIELADRSYEAVRDTIERTRQRRVIGGWNFPVLSTSAQLVFVASAIVIAFVAAVGLVGPRDTTGQVRPAASPSPLAPSPSPTPSPSLAPSPSPTPSVSPSLTLPPRPESPSASALSLPLDGGSLQAGTYQLASGFPVPLTFDVPAGWTACTESVVEQEVCASADNPALANAGVSFLIVDNVVADPCVNEGLVPQIGPTVDDLAAAIAQLDGFQATAPVAISVDGHSGKELVVEAPDSSSCDLFTWLTANRTNGVGVREINRVRIIDVGGVRVMIAAAWFPVGQSHDQPSALKAVFESVSFPPG